VSEHRTLKSIHLAGTAWFILCIIYILVLALRQAGLHWWIIFSLSGHSILIIFLLISLYIFAVLRGVSSTQALEPEHPLTSTSYYRIFYVTAPFLGGLAGCLGMIGESRVTQFAAGIALGTFGTTFLVWVILDPAIGFLEMLLPPASRKHRVQRLAQAKIEREEKQNYHERVLTEVLAKEKSDQHRWQQALRPQAERLAELLTASGTDFKQVERKAVDIGLKAWQMGGLSCMQQLRDIAIAISRERNQNKEIIDYISFWWDGIGDWRALPLDKAILSTQ